MSEKEKELTGKDAMPREKRRRGAVTDALGGLLSRLTEGFWEAVVRSLAGKRTLLSEEFLSVVLFLTMSGVAALGALAAFPLGVYPVPMALAAAIGGFGLQFLGREYSSFGLSASVLLGVFLACFFLPQGLLVCAVLVCFLLFRALCGGGEFCESVMWRALFSAAFCALQTLLTTVFGGGSFGFGAIFLSAVFAAALTLLFSGVFVCEMVKEGGSQRREGARFVLCLPTGQVRVCRLVAVMSFLACALVSLRAAELFGFSLSLLMAGVLTLFVTQKLGTLYGVLCGAVAGLAAASESAAIALVIAAVAAGGGLLHSVPLAAGVSFLCSGTYLLFFSSGSAFALSAADLLLAHLVFFFASRFWREDERAEGRIARLGEVRKSVLLPLREKLVRLSEAFTSLSEVFYMATDLTLTPEGKLAARLVEEAGERVCARCKHSTDCWEQNYGLTREALRRISRVLAEKQRVTPADLEVYFRTRCQKAEALCEEINRRYETESLRRQTAENAASLLCGEYGSVARLLSGEAEGLRREEELSRQQTRRAEEVLDTLGIPYRSAVATGDRNTTLTVTGVNLARLSVSTQKLVSSLSEALGVKFETPEFIAPLSDATMILRRARALRLSCARLSRARDLQPVSGDTTGFFESDVGYFYSLICDGMGSGRQAAFTSRLSSIFIEKLLTFSREKGVTLEMLNRFLLSQKEERFSTVDLLEIDFYTARANFIKAGASASYIKRGTGLYRIASKTPPAGILGELSAEQTTVTLSQGDCVVMFSDGVSSGEDDDAWFAQTLAFAKEKDARALASYLMQQARLHHGAASDDMSISVLQVHAA